MKLIGSIHSPYVRKVRVVLAEKKLECAFVQEDVWSANTDITAINPLGKVPCLIVQEGATAIHDSRVIVEYLDTLSPVGKLLPSTGRERAEVKTLEALADGVCDAAILVRLENTFAGRSDTQRSPEWIRRQMSKVHAGLQALSDALQDQAYFTGVHLGLADIAVGCALGWLSYRFPELDWRTAHPNLARLMDKLEQRPSFANTQPGQGA